MHILHYRQERGLFCKPVVQYSEWTKFLPILITLTQNIRSPLLKRHHLQALTLLRAPPLWRIFKHISIPQRQGFAWLFISEIHGPILTNRRAVYQLFNTRIPDIASVSTEKRLLTLLCTGLGEMCSGSSVGAVTGYGKLFPKGTEIFLFLIRKAAETWRWKAPRSVKVKIPWSFISTPRLNVVEYLIIRTNQNVFALL
jgi:hypothetical protein